MQNIHNSENDYTDRDRVREKYNSLWANRDKHDAEIERAKDLNAILVLSIKEFSFWMVVCVLLVTIVVIVSSI